MKVSSSNYLFIFFLYFLHSFQHESELYCRIFNSNGKSTVKGSSVKNNFKYAR